MPRASEGDRKREQVLVRVTQEQSDILATLVLLLAGSSSADVIRRLVDEERARQEGNPDFQSVLSARQAVRAKLRRARLEPVPNEGTQGHGA